jgi:hypothetical protein
VIAPLLPNKPRGVLGSTIAGAHGIVGGQALRRRDPMDQRGRATPRGRSRTRLRSVDRPASP